MSAILKTRRLSDRGPVSPSPPQHPTDVDDNAVQQGEQGGGRGSTVRSQLIDSNARGWLGSALIEVGPCKGLQLLSESTSWR